MTTRWLLLFLLRSCLIVASRNGLSILLVLVDGPVKDIVILESFTNEEVTEDLAEVRVIRLVIKTERTSVVEIDGEFVGEATAEHLGGSGHLLLHDTVIFLLLGSGLQSLPGKGSAAEVKHHVSEGFHIVTTGLLCNIVSERSEIGNWMTYQLRDAC